MLTSILKPEEAFGLGSCMTCLGCLWPLLLSSFPSSCLPVWFWLVRVRAIAVDNQDHIWVGTYQYGLGEFDGTNWTIYTHTPAGNELSGNSFFAVAVESYNNIWVGTDGGLCEL
jgi:hypothetical protein